MNCSFFYESKDFAKRALLHLPGLINEMKYIYLAFRINFFAPTNTANAIFQYRAGTCNIRVLVNHKICEFQFQFRASNTLKQHEMIHTGEKRFSCHQCPRQFIAKSTLRRHLLVHSNIKPFKCSDCGRLFSSGSHVRRHYKAVHPKLNPKYLKLDPEALKSGKEVVERESNTSGYPEGLEMQPRVAEENAKEDEESSEAEEVEIMD